MGKVLWSSVATLVGAAVVVLVMLWVVLRGRVSTRPSQVAASALPSIRATKVTCTAAIIEAMSNATNADHVYSAANTPAVATNSHGRQ